jgi:hypothetical protein
MALAAGEGRRIDDLLRKSGLWEQVGQMQAQMRAGARDAQEQARAGKQQALSEEDFRRLTAALDRAFAPERLRKSLAAEVEKRVSPAEEEEVLAWLSAELGTKLTRMEVAAGEGDEPAKSEREGPKILEALPAARRERFERIAAAIEAGDSMASTMANITSAIVYGMALATPGMDAAEILRNTRTKLAEQRPLMAAHFTRRAVETYAYMYREASDADLDRYLDFLATPAARRFNDAATKAIDTAVVEASFELGEQFGRDAGRDRRRGA